MFGVSKIQLQRMRLQYPKGTKIKVISMADPHGVPDGTIGEVDFIDDAGQIHMKWSTGSCLALIPGVDTFQNVEEICELLP